MNSIHNIFIWPKFSLYLISPWLQSFHEQGRLNHQSFHVFIHGKEHPELARFLENVVGFDSVDDESRHETSQFTAETPTPDKYNMLDNPVYSYYLWYMYANISGKVSLAGDKRGSR